MSDASVIRTPEFGAQASVQVGRGKLSTEFALAALALLALGFLWLVNFTFPQP